MVQCIHGSPINAAPDDVVAGLPESQGTIARHRCVICAYNAGKKVSQGETYLEVFSHCKHGSIAPTAMIEALPIYQGSLGRHKCVHCAYKAGMQASSLNELVDVYEHSCDEIGSTETVAETKVRRGQNIFRANLIDLWDGQCAVTAVQDPSLLRASHIIPWSKCDSDALRLDKYNGILLSALWDAAFDNGLVSFRDSGDPIISSRLSSRAKTVLENSFAQQASFEGKTLPFLEWHRNNQFSA